MEIVTSEKMQFIENHSQEMGVSKDALMHNAGLSIATFIKTRYLKTRMDQNVVVLTGSGNNGGDGLVAAHHLHSWGFRTNIYLCMDRPIGDKKLSALKTDGTRIVNTSSDNDLQELRELLSPACLVIDAVLGTGKTRPLDNRLVQIFSAVNQAKTKCAETKIISIDLPSGLNPDDGSVESVCPKADVTLSLGHPKIGLFMFPGIDVAGYIEVIDIEEVADKTPDKIIRVIVDPMLGLMPYQIRTLSKGLSSEKALNGSIATLLRNMYEIFVRYDLSMIEINPLVIVQDGRLLAADAKFNIDDDAIFRHPELLTLRDPEQDAILEARAREHGISYVKLDGNVGCMVNGAGLAMATMDVIDAAGALPANFLDVGGGADEKKVEEAMGIILSDPNVEKILINIFGGILRCDIVSRGILSAFNSNLDANLPLVVRMLGTNAEEGRKLLENSNLEVTLVYDLDDAAGVVKMVV